MRRSLFLGSCVVLALVTLAGGASSEPPPVDRNGNVFGLYWIGALTHGRTQFLEEPLGADYDFHGSSSEPEYPFEEEEAIYPHGSADEVIELIKHAVEPWFWEDTDGASIHAMTEDRLVISASPAIHRKVRSYLLELEDDPCISVELVAARGSTAQAIAWSEQGAEAKLDPTTIPQAVRATVMTTSLNRATVTRGINEAVVTSVHATVRGGVAQRQPQTVIGRSGFTATVEFLIAPGGDIVLDIDASVGSVDNERTEDEVDVRTDNQVRWRTSVRLDDGTWRFVGAAGHDTAWGLFARATQYTPPEPPGIKTPHFTPPTGFNEDEAPALRRYRIHHLQRQRRDHPAQYGTLQILGHEPTPPEVPDPEPIWNPDSLVELIQHLVGERFWEEGTIAAMNGDLTLRVHPRALPVIERILAAADVWARRRLVMDVRLYDAPTDITPNANALEAAVKAGNAKHIALAHIHLSPGQRNAARVGKELRYIGNIEVDAADGISVNRAQIQSAFLGLVADVRAQLDATESEVLFTLRLSHQALDSIRKRTTQQGDIELPRLQVFRAQTIARVAIGASVVVSRVDEGGRARIAIVTPRLER